MRRAEFVVVGQQAHNQAEKRDKTSFKISMAVDFPTDTPVSKATTIVAFKTSGLTRLRAKGSSTADR